jgi:tRNA G18 (ribose-2'-O)-methylase SpoU
MRGFFGIGVENISKPMNLGNLMRSAHAFDASFFFTVNAAFNAAEVAKSDTSNAAQHVPLYTFASVEDMVLPKHCKLVGVEFTDDARDLPEIRHPLVAAYVLGREKGSLSREMTEACDVLVKIPTKFCINVGVAGALVMYDRLISQGRFSRRPVSSRGSPEALPKAARGAQLVRRRPTPPDGAAAQGEPPPDES